jgi:DNA-binding transcriptional LysR family regulator
MTLDQLRALVTVVETGSFSAAARKLSRVQSAISTAMANLEAQLGVPLWDRSGKVARLTEQGTSVLAAARRVLAEVDNLRQLTGGLAGGLEASVSLCLDALFPLPALLALCTAFSATYPTVALRIDTQVMSAVSTRVLAGEATLGVVSPRGLLPGLERQVLATIRMVPVIGPSHPLARLKGKISAEQLAEVVQIVLSERSDVAGVADQAVLSSRTWRVADLHTKHELLRAGLGWGNLPAHLVRDDLRKKRLLPLRLMAFEEEALSLSAIYRSDSALGPAHRWLLAQLQTLCAAAIEPPRAQASRPRPRA